MANITLPGSADWTERLLHLFDAVLDRFELAILALAADATGDFGDAVHCTKIRRIAAHGCNGQALM
ncbi:MAG TPA: hypothetical protein VFZ03_07865 [Dongiaceae bacterium]